MNDEYWKRWMAYLPYPRPWNVEIDEAIRLAKLWADASDANCSLAGGYDQSCGQAFLVGEDYDELERLRKLKERGVTSVPGPGE
jgi:hypothetical protein